MDRRMMSLPRCLHLLLLLLALLSPCTHGFPVEAAAVGNESEVSFETGIERDTNGRIAERSFLAAHTEMGSSLAVEGFRSWIPFLARPPPPSSLLRTNSIVSLASRAQIKILKRSHDIWGPGEMYGGRLIGTGQSAVLFTFPTHFPSRLKALTEVLGPPSMRIDALNVMIYLGLKSDALTQLESRLSAAYIKIARPRLDLESLPLRVGGHKLLLEEYLDRGRDGVVYKASSPSLKGSFVVKVFFGQKKNYATEKEALQVISKVAPRRRLAAFDDQDSILVYPYIPGIPLAKKLKTVTSEEEIKSWREKFLALSETFAKKYGMFHLDVRPSNAIILPDGSLTLIDFAKSVKATLQPDSPEWIHHFELESVKAAQEFDFRVAEVKALDALGDEHIYSPLDSVLAQHYIDLLISRRDIERAHSFFAVAKTKGIQTVLPAHIRTINAAPLSHPVHISTDTDSKSF